MSNVVVFVVVLFASMIGNSEAVSCYQCGYTKSSGSESTTCNIPISPTNTRLCSSPICRSQVTNYQATVDYASVQYECANVTGMTTNDSCATYRSQYSVFTYADSCCYTTQGRDSRGSYAVTYCFCQSDYCNGNVQETVVTPPPPSMGMPVLRTPLWAVLSVTFIAMVAIVG